MFEPQKIFIGLIDFFAILLPGALLVFLVRDEAANRVFRPDQHYYYPDGAKGWVIFGFASYLLGHFIFLIGAWLLDKFYDSLRTPTYQKQIERLAAGQQLSCAPFRYASRLFFSKETDSAVRKAVKIKEFYLDPIEATSSMNAFQWSKTRLTLAHPEALANVERFEADSKFFRSLVILCLLILLVLYPFGWINESIYVVWITIPVLFLAFWRYVDQRLKSTNHAYRFVIALEATPESKFRKRTVSAGPVHAGGIVFRKKNGAVDYLLVQQKSGNWVLPRGHIKQSEDMKQTAVRAVRAQAGVWASMQKFSQRALVLVDEAVVPVEFYLMEAVDGRLDEVLARLQDLGRRKRRANWFDFNAARNKVSDPEKEILDAAQKTIPLL